MYEPSLESIGDAVLGIARLRELAREAHPGPAPERVARALRHRMPCLIESESKEIAALLADLIEAVPGRLHAPDSMPRAAAEPPVRSSPKREREVAADVAVLFTYAAAARNWAGADGMKLAADGIAWARRAGDDRQEALLWRGTAAGHLLGDEDDAAEIAHRRAVEIAGRSGSIEPVVAAMGGLCAMLAARRRLDDAEAVVNEALVLLRADPESEARVHYAWLMMNRGLIELYRAHEAQGIQTLREAQRWCGVGEDPRVQMAIMGHLGTVYLQLGQCRQSVECRRHVVRMADVVGSDTTRGRACLRLAEAHLRLKEPDRAEEMLACAWRSAKGGPQELRLAIAGEQAVAASEAGDYERSLELCRRIIGEIGEGASGEPALFAHRTLAEIETRLGRRDEACRSYERAVEIARCGFPEHARPLGIALARSLHASGRTAEAATLLDDIEATGSPDLADRIGAVRLRGAIAEARGDIRDALDRERDAMALERELIERRTEESLRNARIVAEADLLEREAELERTRRARLERELAETMVELRDRKQFERIVETHLNDALERVGGQDDPAAGALLREMLAQFHRQRDLPENSSAYGGIIDDEFLARLRARWPDLTRKQERLCGMLRAGMGSKEIALLIGVGADGVKAQRKRLRKKLGLAEEESLERILAAL